ncbi:MAG TPA: hypothetical protein VGQ10_17505 [Vicinamibacterales bacterium]|jgi:hypothetical protein|nr:hypothetical protein [Vicinamibacterales bacterium]
MNRVSILAFVLGFIGVMALASGWSIPAASQADERGFGMAGAGSTLDQHGGFNYVNTTGYSDGLPQNTDVTLFGTLMPDGTYCGVGCPESNP